MVCSMRRRKKKNSWFWIFVSVAALFFIWKGFEPEQPAPRTAQQQQRVAAQRTLSPSYAQQALVNTWPPMSGQQGLAYEDATQMLTANYYIMLDASGSMLDRHCAGDSPTQMHAAAQAIDAFAQAVPPEANLGLAIFNGIEIKELLPLAKGHQQVGKIIAAVPPNASTPLAKAMQFTYDKLTEQAQRQLGYGEYYLVLVTDGIADRGQEPGPMIQKILQESPVQIYTIGFCIDERHDLNQPGRTVYHAADNPQALEESLRGVLAEAPSFILSDFVTE
jgi:Ca-activated chloride channel homolog